MDEGWESAPVSPAISKGETHVWCFDLDDAAEVQERFERSLGADEMARANRFKFARDRARFVIARGQLRAILSRYTGVAPEQLNFSYSNFGKPSLAGIASATSIRFNASGSDRMGILAVRMSDDVGIDIERIREFADAADVAARMFTADEHAALAATSEAQRTVRFFQHWTRKEAIVKALDTGIFQPLRFAAAMPHPGDALQRIEIERDGLLAAHWVRVLPPPREGFIAAVASDAQFQSLRCWRI